MRLANNCKQEIIHLLYPVIIAWSGQYGYRIPPLAWFLSYDYDFIPTINYGSSYRGKSTTVVGTHNGKERIITVASKRPMRDVFKTLAHELGHAVQRYKYGKQFSAAYHAEVIKSEYSKNQFEVQARAIENLFLYDSALQAQLEEFKLTYRPVKDHTEWHYHYTTEISYWNDPNFKPYRKSWWLRR